MTAAEAPLRIYLDLTGDLPGPADIALLGKARGLGGCLVLGVLSDADVERASHVPVMSLEERIAVLAACRHVDEVVPAPPLAIGEAFLERYSIDYVCLVDDYDLPERQAAHAALLEQGRALVLPRESGVGAAELVARIAGRAETPSPRPGGRPAEAARVHAPFRSDAERLQAIGREQRRLSEAVGTLAAAMLGEAALLPTRQAPAGDPWLRNLRASVRERLALSRPDDDAPGTALSQTEMVSRTLGKPPRLVLAGGGAIAVAHALAEDRGDVTVLLPGTTPTVAAQTAPRGAVLGGAAVRGCGWAEIGLAWPAAEAGAILDGRLSSFLLRDAYQLRQIASAVTDRLLLLVDLSPSAESGIEATVEGRFRFSDLAVREALHAAGFYEVADIATLVDGLPRDSGQNPPRTSRLTPRRAVKHGHDLAFLDGGSAIALPVAGTVPIERWYQAARRTLSGRGT